jgi:hypothetical protein
MTCAALHGVIFQRTELLDKLYGRQKRLFVMEEEGMLEYSGARSSISAKEVMQSAKDISQLRRECTKISLMR